MRRLLALGAAAGIVASSAAVGSPAFADGGTSPAPAPSTGAAAPGTQATAAATAPSPSSSPAPASSPSPSGSPAPSSSSGSAAAGLSEAALADAVQRDLKLTPEQFAAAGEQGAAAAAAAVRLRQVPGYVGIRIEGSSIVVTGSGQELQAAVTALAGSIHGLSLEAPPAAQPAPAPAGAAPSPAPTAEGRRSQLAVNPEQLFHEYVREVGTAGLQAVVATTGGTYVIRMGSLASAQSTQDAAGTPAGAAAAEDVAAPGKISPAQFVSRYANVQLDGGAPLKPEAAEVPGGVGYQTDRQTICSTGFAAFDPAGLPAVLTAGHCTDDGTANTADLLFQGVPNGRLGSFGFSQFGGPGNSTVLNPKTPTDTNGAAATDPGNVGTDIAVIGGISQGLDPLPAASTYGDPSQPGPDVKVIGTAAPVVGMPVCRSGWRTEWSCGHISAVGVFLVGGHHYATDPTDVRAFNGFLSYDVQSNGGDSGGPWVSGNYAVGTHSAGDDGGTQNFAVAATLEDSLKVLPGYQLELFLNQPGLTPPADNTVKAGTPITGRVPAAPASAVAAGSQVRITSAGRPPADVPVQPDGSWSFTAPEAPGPFSFTAETVNGFSRSGAVSLEVAISPSFLPAPAITTPAAQPLPALKTVDGTGTPGATITLSGDAAGTALVGADGHWSIALPAPAPAGKAGITAVQSYQGLADSPPTSVTFSVMPPPPSVTSLADGQHFAQDTPPASLQGAGLTGAEVAVSLDGKPLAGTAATDGAGAAGSRSVGSRLAPLVLVAGGTWTVPFPAGLAPGRHTLAATQAVDGVASAPVQLTFTIDAPPPVLPAGNISAAGLAATGASGLLPAALGAAAALVVGILLMLLVRRRRRQC